MWSITLARVAFSLVCRLVARGGGRLQIPGGLNITSSKAPGKSLATKLNALNERACQQDNNNQSVQ